MKVNIQIDISDNDRRLLKQLIIGKETKALITRREVRELIETFVESILQRAWDTDPGELQSPPPANHNDEAERCLILRLRADGHNDNYIRGALQVFRAVRS